MKNFVGLIFGISFNILMAMEPSSIQTLKNFENDITTLRQYQNQNEKAKINIHLYSLGLDKLLGLCHVFSKPKDPVLLSKCLEEWSTKALVKLNHDKPYHQELLEQLKQVPDSLKKKICKRIENNWIYVGNKFNELEPLRLKDQKKEITSLSWAHDGSLLASEARGMEVCFYDCTKKNKPKLIKRFEEMANVSFLKNTSYFSAIDKDGKLVIFDYTNKQDIKEFAKVDSNFDTNSWSHDTNLLVGLINGSFCLFNAVDKSKITQVGELLKINIWVGAFWSPTENLLAVAGKNDSTVKIYNLKDLQNIHLITTLKGRSCDNCDTVAWSSDGKRLAYATQKDEVIICKNGGATFTQEKILSPGYQAIKWSPDNQKMVTISSYGGLFYSNCSEDKLSSHKITLHQGYWNVTPQKMSWSPDSKFLAVEKFPPYSIELFHHSNRGLSTVSSLENDLQNASWSPDNQFLAYVKGEKTLCLRRINFEKNFSLEQLIILHLIMNTTPQSFRDLQKGVARDIFNTMPEDVQEYLKAKFKLYL